ncbi:MAG: hypothetical protein JWP80_3362 [Pseudomonas sp.]|nr:hypothetical protein [Pseudomonas sp.]
MKNHGKNALADGDLDPEFGEGGIVELNNLDLVPTLTLLTTGQFLVCGSVAGQFTVTRLHTDGSIDPTFIPITNSFGEGATSLGGGAYAQDDDKLIVIGHVRQGDQYYLAVARFNKDSTFDTDFGENGKRVFLDLPLGSGPIDPTHTKLENVELLKRPDGVAGITGLLPNNKILLSGYQPNPGVGLIIQLDENGNLDPDFNDHGYVQFRHPQHPTIIRSAALVTHTDGTYHIIAAGNVTTDRGARSLFVCFDAAGKLVSSFGNEGFEVVADDYVNHAVIAQADGTAGKFIGAGMTSTECMLTRRNADGRADKDFNGGKIVVTEIGESTRWEAVRQMNQGDKIIAAGWTVIGEPGTVIARFTSNGKLDTDFGRGAGWVRLALGDGGLEGPESMVLQPDNKIVVSIGYGDFSAPKRAVVRFMNPAKT